MSRKFKTANYEKTLELQIRLGEVLPPGHLARFMVDVIAQLDLSGIYEQYSDQGAPPYAPEVLLGLLFYGYATGIFSTRKIEKATYEVVSFRYIAGDMHPDHATISLISQRAFGRVERVVCANTADRPRNGLCAGGQCQSGWEQNPCGCLQEQSGQLQATVGHRSLRSMSCSFWPKWPMGANPSPGPV